MLQLILGKTGTGKTAVSLKRSVSCAQNGGRTILLVPEQFSFEAERSAFSVLRGTAALRLSVLSFSRLAENIFRAHGGLAGKRLTDTARVVLMRLALKEMRDTLTVYESQAEKPGFLNTMLDTVEELKQSGTSPETLAAVARRVEDPQLSLKLGDIAGVYGAYCALVDRSYADPLDDLSKAVELARENRFFAGMRIFVDGFDFFSPPEREMLYTMMEQAEEVSVTLCADGLGLREGVDLFLDQKNTAQRLLSYAKEHFVTVKPTEYLWENRRTQVPALQTVEEMASGEELPAEETFSQGLTLIEARTAYEELRYVAGEIARLVQQEGYRYREIALVCRKMDDYRTTIRAVLENSGIPLFMDRKESVLSRPIASFVMAALEAACGNFRTEAVLKVARSPAMGLTEEEAAALENYAYVWSVRGEGWLFPFRGNPSGLTDQPPESYAEKAAQVEATRYRLLRPLEELRGDLRHCDGRGFSNALYRFVRETKALEHLKEYLSQEDATGLPHTQENDRLWNSIVDILDLFSQALEGVGQSPREFLDLFSLALAQTKLGNIPTTNDQVIAGAADTVRLASPRAVFVLGVNEGVFPARVGPHGVFTDRERDALVAQGVEVASTTLQRAVQERYYLYTALCSPRERLYVSYSRSDEKGAPLQPALLTVRLTQRFPDALLREAETSPYFFVHDLESAREEYARLAAGDTSACATLEQLLQERGQGDFLASLEKAIADAPAAGIGPDAAKALLGDRMILSPSRIETFYRCPYQFFCNYMMGLSPRKRVAYTPLESGTAIHYVLEMLLKELGGKGIGSLSDGELRERIQRYLTQYIEGMSPDLESLSARFQYQFQRLSALLFTILRHIGREFDQSMFTAAGMEVTVGPAGEVRPAQLRLEDGTAVELVGKIDRVDTYEDDTGRYVRVVDYKSGGKIFRLEDVAFGLNMQMLLYLFALCDDTVQHFGPVEPAGILYMPGNLSAVDASDEKDPDQVREELARKLRMSGVVLDDEHVLRAMERELEGKYIPVKQKRDQSYTATSRVESREGFSELRRQVYDHVAEMARQIRKGEVAPLPARNSRLNPCQNCDYCHLCNDCKGPVFRDISDAGENGADPGKGGNPHE